MPDIALSEWQNEYFQQLSEAEDQSSALPEDKEEAEARLWLSTLCERAPALYKAMVSQQLPEALQEALLEIGNAPIEHAGFDARRLMLVPEIDDLYDHLDVQLLYDAIAHLRTRESSERHRVFSLLVVTALDDGSSPIATWYFQRAARLLLLGLDVECTAICRAVLEAALKFSADADDTSESQELTGTSLKNVANLHSRIEGAWRSGVFSDSEKVAASQYGSLEFGQCCELLGVPQSMGSQGDAYDTAMAEIFFSTFDRECLARHRFTSQAHARSSSPRHRELVQSASSTLRTRTALATSV